MHRPLHRTSTSLGALAVTLVLAGCAEAPTSPDGAVAPMLAAPDRPSMSAHADGPEHVDLAVAFRDQDEDGLRSDGNEDYAGEFQTNGFFWMDIRDEPGRTLCLHFPEDAGLDNLCETGFMRGFPQKLPSFQEMEVGSEQDAVLTFRYVQGRNWWLLLWGQDCENNERPEERARATRTSEDTWTIEGLKATLCTGPMRGRPTVDEVAKGLDMPVLMTLQAVEPPGDDDKEPNCPPNSNNPRCQ